MADALIACFSVVHVLVVLHIIHLMVVGFCASHAVDTLKVAVTCGLVVHVRPVGAYPLWSSPPKHSGSLVKNLRCLCDHVNMTHGTNATRKGSHSKVRKHYKNLETNTLFHSVKLDTDQYQTSTLMIQLISKAQLQGSSPRHGKNIRAHRRKQ